MEIHSTALVSKHAKIDQDVSIGPYCIIGENVAIGPGTKLLSHVIIDGKTTIGKNNTIYPFVSLGLDPQDYKYNGEDTSLEIGDNNIFRESVTIHKGTLANQATKIGSHNMFLAYSHVGHDCEIGDYCTFSNSVNIAGHCIIDDYVKIGGLSGIHQFCKIGKHAMIGGMSGISQDILPFLIIAGHPPKPRGINYIGLKRNDYNAEQLDVLRDAYTTIFRSKLGIKEATNVLSDKYANNSDITYLISFTTNCERGICR